MLELRDDARATIDVMQSRLLAWAAWLKGGSNAAGYPTKNVLHQSWMPPAPGQLPSMRTASGVSTAQERALHGIICTLNHRLQNTLVVVYVMRAGSDEQVRLLECQASTVRARIREAKALLGQLLRAV